MEEEFFWGGLDSLVSLKESRNAAAAYNDILGNSTLPVLQQFGVQFGRPSPVYSAPMHKTRPIKKWLSQFHIQELDFSAQSSDLSPIQDLWDELECFLRARLIRNISA